MVGEFMLESIVAVKSECKKCHRTAHQTQLDLHHKDGNSNNDDWKNIIILCRACHNDKENTVPKNRHK